MTRKTTVYLPDTLKHAVERAARSRACSEAEVIGQAIAASVAMPRPSAGFLDGEPSAEHADEPLAGFGDR